MIYPDISYTMDPELTKIHLKYNTLTNYFLYFFWPKDFATRRVYVYIRFTSNPVPILPLLRKEQIYFTFTSGIERKQVEVLLFFFSKALGPSLRSPFVCVAVHKSRDARAADKSMHRKQIVIFHRHRIGGGFTKGGRNEGARSSANLFKGPVTKMFFSRERFCFFPFFLFSVGRD